MMPYILIVWRPNVGKSSFFNALTKHKIAIVAEESNTTRDVIEYTLEDDVTKRKYILADSGGLNIGNTQDILMDINERVGHHAKNADLIIFLAEYDKITTEDHKIANMLRRSGKPVFLVANKADNEARELESYQLMELGFEHFFPVSVTHRRGIEELRSAISEFIAHEEFADADQHEEEDDGSLKIALIGRPNVGKSSIFNRLLGQNKVMVRDEWGTTRDSTDTKIEFNENPITLIDTAGLRKPGKVGTRNIENWSMMRTNRAIERSDICAILLDPVEGITQQDKNVVSMALEHQKGIVLVFNKWDLAVEGSEYNEEETRERFMEYLQKHFGFIPWAATTFCSATENKKVTEILENSIGIHEERQKRIGTGLFNNFLQQMCHKHTPRGTRKSHKPKVFFGSQVDRCPPKFLLSVNNSNHFHFSWKRYLENQIRKHFGFFGTPIEIELRGRNDKIEKVKEEFESEASEKPTQE